MRAISKFFFQISSEIIIRQAYIPDGVLLTVFKKYCTQNLSSGEMHLTSGTSSEEQKYWSAKKGYPKCF